MAVGTIFNGFEWPSPGAETGQTGPTGAGTLDVNQTHMRNGHMDWGDGSWIVMMVMMGLFWAGILALAWYAIRVFGRRGRTGGPAESALDIARRRYAGGEISAEEFEAIRRTLL